MYNSIQVIWRYSLRRALRRCSSSSPKENAGSETRRRGRITHGTRRRLAELKVSLDQC